MVKGDGITIIQAIIQMYHVTIMPGTYEAG